MEEGLAQCIIDKNGKRQNLTLASRLPSGPFEREGKVISCLAGSQDPITVVSRGNQPQMSFENR
jgi:hypothetical protein